MPKSSEKELARKRDYYQKNKQAILDKKHERNPLIQLNKRMREQSDDAEYEKEWQRKFSKQELERPDKCDGCHTAEETLEHKLELHHEDYEKTEGKWLCKPCHAKADMARRRQTP